MEKEEDKQDRQKSQAALGMIKLDFNTILTAIVLASILYVASAVVKLQAATDMLIYRIEKIEQSDNGKCSINDFKLIMNRLDILEKKITQ